MKAEYKHRIGKNVYIISHENKKYVISKAEVTGVKIAINDEKQTSVIYSVLDEEKNSFDRYENLVHGNKRKAIKKQNERNKKM